MIRTFGFEQEFFVKKIGKFVLAADIPHDDCGYLAEARSEPHADPLKAVFLLKHAVHTLTKEANRKGYTLITSPFQKLPVDFTKGALRRFGKRPRDYKNMYGTFYSNNDTLSRAGVHIHFGTLQTFGAGKSFRSCVELVDMPHIIRTLDVAFEKEIKNAKRLPGEYALKVHGFEYRSLPNTVDLEKVAEVLQALRHA